MHRCKTKVSNCSIQNFKGKGFKCLVQYWLYYWRYALPAIGAGVVGTKFVLGAASQLMV